MDDASQKKLDEAIEAGTASVSLHVADSDVTMASCQLQATGSGPAREEAVGNAGCAAVENDFVQPPEYGPHGNVSDLAGSLVDVDDLGFNYNHIHEKFELPRNCFDRLQFPL